MSKTDRDAGRYLIYPENKNDREGIVKFADAAREVALSYRIDIERNSMANILFWLGLHWIEFDTYSRVYRPVRLKKKIPRVTTNKFAAVVANSASRLSAYKPPLSINPGSAAADDIASAEVGDKVRQIIEKEAEIRDLKPLAALWTLLTGNCFLLSSYDMSGRSGKVFVPFDRCLTCEQVSSPVDIEAAGMVCPKCGEGTTFQPALSGKGEPIGVDQPRGKHYTELKTVFETHYDYEVPLLKDSPYFLIAETQSRQWIKDTYGKAVADKVDYSSGSTEHGEFYLKSLSYTAAGGRFLSGMGAGHRNEDRARVTRLYMKPSDSYPEGMYAVILGTDLVEDNMDLPYHDENGDGFIPVSHLKFDHVPGRVYGKSRCDDIRPKQKQRNRIETILELHSRRMANSLWLVPRGANVNRIGGEEGMILDYNALAGVPAPTRIPGDNPPPYLVAWLPQIDAEIDDVFGSKEILRGEVPEGVSAYAAIALIDERARQGQSSLLENWSVGWMRWTKQNLDIWREYATRERTLSAGFGTWEIEKFNNARFIGGVDVDVDLGENRPTTMVAKRAALEQAARNGALNMMDPLERYKFLEALGIDDLMEDHKLHMREAEKENDLFKSMAQDPAAVVPPPMPWQQHPLHIVRHHRFIMSDTFKQLPPPVQAAVLEHTMLHQASMMPMMLQPGQAVPGPGGGSEGSAKGSATSPDASGAEAQGASPDTFTGGGGMS